MFRLLQIVFPLIVKSTGGDGDSADRYSFRGIERGEEAHIDWWRARVSCAEDVTSIMSTELCRRTKK